MITLIEDNRLSIDALDEELMINSSSFMPYDNPFIRFASYIFINPSKPKFAINLNGTKEVFLNETILSEISTEDSISQKWRNNMLSEFLKFVSSIKNQTNGISGHYNQIEALEELNLLQNKVWLDQFNISRVRELSFINAAYAAELTLVEAFLDSEVDINARLKTGSNALHIASQGASILNASYLGINEDQLPQFKENYTKMLKKLIAKIDINSQDERGNTPIYLASLSNNTVGVKILIDHNASLIIESYNGATPIYKAAEKGRVDVVDMILSKDKSLANIQVSKTSDDTTYVGRTPLHAVAFNGDMKMAKILTDYGAQIDILDHHNRTPLCHAASANQVKMIYFLKEKNALLELIPIYLSPIHYAAIRGHIESAKALIEVGATIDGCPRDSYCDVTSIMSAIINNRLNMVQFLLAHGAKGTLKCEETNLIEKCEEQTDKSSCNKIQNNIELHNNHSLEYDSCYFKDKLTNNNFTIVVETRDFIFGQQQPKDEDCPPKLTKYVQWLNQSEVAKLELEQCINYLVDKEKPPASTQQLSDSSSMLLQDQAMTVTGVQNNDEL